MSKSGVTTPPAVLQIINAAKTKTQTGTKGVNTVICSLAFLEEKWAEPAQIEVDALGAFITEVSNQLVAAALPDMQIYLQAGDPEKIWGAIIDIDRKVPNISAQWNGTAVPKPNLLWGTKHGHKLAYVFKEAATYEVFQRFTRWVCVAFQADTNSAVLTQGQALPHMIKSRLDDTQEIVNFPVEQISTSPVDPGKAILDDYLPRSMERLFGMGHVACITEGERAELEHYLESIGIEMPQGVGSKRGSICPWNTHLSANPFKITREEGGNLDAYCFACDRGGNGRKLYAQLVQKNRVGGPALKSMPYTWATKGLLSHRLKTEGWAESLVKMALIVWLDFQVKMEYRRLRGLGKWYEETKYSNALTCDVAVPTESNVRESLVARLKDWHGIAPANVFYEQSMRQLSYFGRTGEIYPIKPGAETLRYKVKSYEPYWVAGAGHYYLPEVQETKSKDKNAPGINVSVNFKLSNDIKFEAHFSQALNGNPDALKKLGFPTAEVHRFPACFTESSFEINEVTGCIHHVAPGKIPKAQAGFNLEDFFRDLHRRQLLPFATWDDVLRFLKLVASPLARMGTSGQSGIHWISGTSGVGKAIVYTLINEIWAPFRTGGVAVCTEESMANETEFQRKLFAGKDSLYLTFVEGSKERGSGLSKLDTLIEMSTAATATIRDMRATPQIVDNRWGFIVDSAEGVPEGIEIKRRTNEINLSKKIDSSKKSALIDAVQKTQGTY